MFNKFFFKQKRENIKVNGVGNNVDRELLKKLGVKLTINGNNNVVTIGKKSNLLGKLNIELNGDNNIIDIGNVLIQVGLTIIAGFEHCKTANSQIIIKDNTAFNEVQIMLLEKDSVLNVGSNSMFSGNIMIHLTDGHSITDYDGNLLNHGGEVNIGDRVWVGRNVTILKNATIPDGSIVGMGSVVSKKFEEKDTIIAGIPARVVKRKVLWLNTPPSVYKEEMEKKAHMG